MNAVNTQRMHADEVHLDAPLVQKLIARRFPEWAGLPVRRLASFGTENAMFRLGTDLVVRLPRRPGAVPDLVHEQRWLPRLGPLLPVAVPQPVGVGEPDAGYPWPWSVYRWLQGTNPGGWALSISLIQLPYYWDTNPALAENSRHVVAEMLAEAG
ncbi:phosphotransferase [Streptomyces sp. AF1A]|uniref:phosphotransferase n=1 Tax=Streptomyces sp. AF1A TaxID=3394350 RepID=UPI0039BD54CF